MLFNVSGTVKRLLNGMTHSQYKIMLTKSLSLENAQKRTQKLRNGKSYFRREHSIAQVKEVDRKRFSRARLWALSSLFLLRHAVHCSEHSF